ncbi:CAP domain-containing protein [Chytriomyces cf. hyalinus JEL632]|nr:CAP domain-containing protein [Chytriomyces cf. hyalinus JEL632]
MTSCSISLTSTSLILQVGSSLVLAPASKSKNAQAQFSLNSKNQIVVKGGNNQCLSLSSGNSVKLVSCKGAISWTYAAPYIQPKGNSKLCLESLNKRMITGNAVALRNCNLSKYQKWKFPCAVSSVLNPVATTTTTTTTTTTKTTATAVATSSGKDSRIDCNVVNQLVSSYVSTSSASNDVVGVHNAVRNYVSQQLKLTKPLASLVWNQSLAQGAALHGSVGANKGCILEHVVDPTINFPHRVGQNLYMTWGSGLTSISSDAFVDAAALWIDECELYDGSNMNTFHEWGHYSQVLAPESLQVGCASIMCPTVSGYIVTCDYYPPGNWVKNNIISIGNGY